jgi:ParB family chromosome partitioning protein
MSKAKRFAMPKIGAAPEIDDLPRRPGPMAVAGRDAGEAVTRVLEEQAEQRRRNADDADAWRAAESEGRVLLSIPLDAVRTDSLPRDRMALEAVATDDAMEELKASLRARGQREPIAVFPAGQGVWQLKTGWRRLEALRQLHAETGAARFATVLARVDHAIADRAGLYVGMVEENAVRENVSFAEMAQVAIAMARDPHTAASNPDEAVSTLYGALHKAKRSAIRRFVDLLTLMGDALPEPRAIPKNLGADAARLLAAAPRRAEALRARLAIAADAEAQNAALQSFVAEAATEEKVGTPSPHAPSPSRIAFRQGDLAVSAQGGALTIRSEGDFTAIPRGRLEAAIAAFRAHLDG